MSGQSMQGQPRAWTFLTSHARVMIAIRGYPTLRMRDIADAVGITERATRRIIADLERAGYLTRLRDGRRNRYTVHSDGPMRHPLNQHHELAELLDVLPHASSNSHQVRLAWAEPDAPDRFPDAPSSTASAGKERIARTHAPRVAAFRVVRRSATPAFNR